MTPLGEIAPSVCNFQPRHQPAWVRAEKWPRIEIT